ncbi:MAG TPA: hypothetical protein VLA09_12930 [Longimicrobiales bacterium]|nr:hypothetical protein [Longimicrobiales bacterium]
MKRALVPVLVALACAQCEALPHELRQLLGVQVTTTGDAPDPDGYVAVVDGDPALSKAVATNGSVTFEGLAAGAHWVKLSGLADNCDVVDGPRVRTVTVTADGVVQVAFRVNCEAPPVRWGSLLVEVRTTGPDPDLDGYTISLDDLVTRTVGPNGAVTFERLAVRDHTVELGGIVERCTVQGATRRTVSVDEGLTTQVTFVIDCRDGPPPQPGWVVVQAITTGSGSTGGVYTVAVDGSAASTKSVSANGSVVFEDVAPGEHTVLLRGLPTGCTLTVPNPQAVTVPAGGVVDVVFTVSCASPSGSLVVEVVTTGKHPDRDGYIATVDGSATERQAVGPNGSVLFEGLAVGVHSVELSAVASNCTLLVRNPQTFTVAAGVVSAVTFLVSCPARSGSG